MTTAALSQSHFRGRSDASSVDTAATFIAAVDTNYNLGAGITSRIRFTVQETGGGNPAAATVKLQAQKNSGGYFDVTTSSTIVKAIDAGASAEDTSIATKQLTGTGSYIAGRYSEDGSPATTVDMTASSNTEWEFGFQIVAGDVALSDTINLKVVALSGTSITATTVPTITVNTIPATLTPSLFTNSQTFYAPTVAPGAVALTPSLFSNSQTFYSPTVAIVGLAVGEYTITLHVSDGEDEDTQVLTITVVDASLRFNDARNSMYKGTVV